MRLSTGIISSTNLLNLVFICTPSVTDNAATAVCTGISCIPGMISGFDCFSISYRRTFLKAPKIMSNKRELYYNRTVVQPRLKFHWRADQKHVFTMLSIFSTYKCFSLFTIGALTSHSAVSQLSGSFTCDTHKVERSIDFVSIH